MHSGIAAVLVFTYTEKRSLVREPVLKPSLLWPSNLR